MPKFILLLLLPLSLFATSYESILLDLELQLMDAIEDSFRDRGYNPSVIYESYPLQDGWRESWFGTFYQTNSDWIFHCKLGWLYPREAEEGYWLYSEFYGWMWSNSSTCPYFYSPDYGWLFFYMDYGYFYVFDTGEMYNF